MAVSLSRIAAFEFLIQFRSAGSSELRRATQNLRDLAGRARLSGAALERASRSAARYTASVRAAAAANRRFRAVNPNSTEGLAALRARNFSRGRALLEARNTINRGRQGRVTARRQRFNDSFGRILSSRGISVFSRVFGAKNAARLSSGLASARVGFTRLAGPIGVVVTVLGGFLSVLRIGLSLFARWARFNTLLVAGVGLLGFGIAKLADNFINLSNRLRVTSDGTQTVQQTMNEILDIAIRSRAPFSDLAELYGRIAINAKQFGVSTRDIASVTEITGKAFRIGGSNAREASQAAIQFSQALGSNRLSGDELRAVREQAPELSQTLARGLTALGRFGKVGVGDLKKFGEEGVLTTEVVVSALKTQEAEVNRRFARLERTFSDAFTNIRSILFFFSSSVITTLNLGPRLNAFTDGIVESFRKLSSRTGELGAALAGLPRLFRALGLTGLGSFFKFLEGIGSFFETLPDRILRAAEQINNFNSAITNGASVEEAAQRAFGISGGELRGRFEGVDTLIGGAVKQFQKFLETAENLITAINNLATVINRVVDFFQTDRGSTLANIAQLISPVTAIPAASRIGSAALTSELPG